MQLKSGQYFGQFREILVDGSLFIWKKVDFDHVLKIQNYAMMSKGNMVWNPRMNLSFFLNFPKLVSDFKIDPF